MRTVAEADRRICLGNIEYHYFAGYSGGAKAIMPGVSTRAAIRANHSHMVEPGSHAAALAGNPVREDIEEAAALVGVDYIVNVVLDEHKHIVHAVAGDVTAAHRAGCAYLEQFYRRPIPARADIVLVSQGGAPKDANLYQLQKALDTQARRERRRCDRAGGLRQGGLWRIHLRAVVPPGAKPRAIIERLREDFVLGGHKAAAIALVEERADIYLVSDWPDEAVRGLFMTPSPMPRPPLMRQCSGAAAPPLLSPCPMAGVPARAET